MTGLLLMALGGLIPVGLLTLLIKRFGFKNPDSTLEALMPVVMAYFTTVLIAGFGMADGGSPKFAEAAIVYGISAIIVAILVFIGFKRKLAAEDELDG